MFLEGNDKSHNLQHIIFILYSSAAVLHRDKNFAENATKILRQTIFFTAKATGCDVLYMLYK